MTASGSVPKFYKSVIDDVISSIREIFLDDGIDEQVIQELRQNWERKVFESRAVEQQPTGETTAGSTAAATGIASNIANNSLHPKQSKASKSGNSSQKQPPAQQGQTSVITSNPNHVTKNGAKRSPAPPTVSVKRENDHEDSVTRAAPPAASGQQQQQPQEVLRASTIVPNSSMASAAAGHSGTAAVLQVLPHPPSTNGMGSNHIPSTAARTNTSSANHPRNNQPGSQQLGLGKHPNSAFRNVSSLATSSTNNSHKRTRDDEPGSAGFHQKTLRNDRRLVSDAGELTRLAEAAAKLPRELIHQQSTQHPLPLYSAAAAGSHPINLSASATQQYYQQQQQQQQAALNQHYLSLNTFLHNLHGGPSSYYAAAARFPPPSQSNRLFLNPSASTPPVSSCSRTNPDQNNPVGNARSLSSIGGGGGGGIDDSSAHNGGVGGGAGATGNPNNKDIKFNPATLGMAGPQKLVFVPNNVMPATQFVINHDNVLSQINLPPSGIFAGGQPVFQHPGLGAAGTLQYVRTAMPPNALPQMTLPTMATSVLPTQPSAAGTSQATTPQPPSSQQPPGRVAQLDGPRDQNDSSEDDDEDDEDDYRDNDDDIDDNDDEMNDEENEAGVEEEPLNSEDDVSDEDPNELFETDNVVVCQFDKITRSRNKWKFHLKDGIMNLQGKDYVFSRAVGDAEW